MSNSFDSVEPKAMGQLKAEAAKQAHETLMVAEDSTEFLSTTNEREEADRRLIARASKVEPYGYESVYRGAW